MESIKHKFYEISFDSEFKTELGILRHTPYKPEILILGTFNPDTPKSNFADFFYGRNYFWPALKRIFKNNDLKINASRMPKNGKPRKDLNPNINEIFDLCTDLKLTFADLILEVLHDNSNYHVLDNDNICFNDKTFNLILDGKKGQISGLAELDKLKQVHWNTQNIIGFLKENPQIKTVYFTRQPTGVWKEHWNKIQESELSNDRVFENIFTPSGQGKPVLNSLDRLIRHWIFNDNPNFGNISQLMKKHEIKTDKFR